MAIEIRRPTTFTSPAVSAAACSSMTATSGHCGPASGCLSGALKTQDAEWYSFQVPQFQAYYASLVLSVVWSLGALQPEDCCQSNSANLQYSTNGGSSWANFSTWPKSGVVNGPQSGTATVSLIASQNLSNLRVRATVSVAATTPCGKVGEFNDVCFCDLELSISDVFTTGTYTLPTGACCSGVSCSVTTQSGCAYVYKGNGTSCSPNPCGSAPITGACCDGTACSQTQAGDCGATYKGDGVLCSPNPCTVSGACCTSGVCQVTTQGACDSEYKGDGTVCTPSPCAAAVGACCNDATCTETTQANCAHVYQGDGVLCSSSPCVAEDQARPCCNGGDCTVMFRSQCESAGGEVQWAQANCSQVLCPQPSVISSSMM